MSRDNKKKEPELHIAVDGNEANVSQRVGSNAFAYELLCALERITRKRYHWTFTILLSSPVQKDMPPKRVGWEYKVVTPRPFWTQFALPLHLFKKRKIYDLFFTPGHYAPRVSPVPYVSSIMDLAYLYFPKQFRRKDYLQLKEWTRYSVKNAKKIITISQFSKNDVIKNYGKKDSDIVVAYPALSGIETEQFSLNKKKKVLHELGIRRPFLLYVGTLQPRKNLVRVIHAFEQVIQEKSKKSAKKKKSLFGFEHYNAEKLQLVIAGKIGWLADEILHTIKKSEYKDRIILTGFVTEEQKAVLYQESLASILVGLYEGFGIPALEAMASSTVPIVSNTTSLPEVVGSAGIQVNPEKTHEVVQAIEKVLSLSAKERAALLKKGREQVHKFRWEKSAGIVLKTLQEAVTTKTS